jgi:high affinity Mn2+ porin
VPQLGAGRTARTLRGRARSGPPRDRRARPALRTALTLGILLSAGPSLRGQEESPAESPESPPWWNFHFQQTIVIQHHGSFSAAYSGQNSLIPTPESKTSVTATIWAGAKLWKGAELYTSPELSGGDGLSHTSGIAGFPNGEVYRIGNPAPVVVMARLYLQQTFGFGEETEPVADAPDQLPGRYPVRRLVVKFGKFSLADSFDDNRFSHDPRAQFLNWALMDNGAWDYAADTRGYTWGVHAEYQERGWALRAAAVLVPVVANQLQLDLRIHDAHAWNFEGERKYSLFGHPGTTRLFLYRNLARMGNYREALALSPTSPDITQTRRYGRDKNGAGIGVEQEVAEDAGLFMRVGWSDGKNETWAFTEIDRTASLGALWGGKAWGRKKDSVGGALVVNGLSQDHRDYLAAGGYGFIIGDGALRYGSEMILEAFYNLQLPHGLSLSGDYQHVVNPAYNQDRGPVDVVGFRAHLEF